MTETAPVYTVTETIPLEMIAAYVPEMEHLNLEAAAAIACERDEQAASDLVLSIFYP